MFALGLQGSPRRKGNTDYLLGRLMEALEKKGVSTQIVAVAQKKISPCRGCGNCERTGFCMFDDEMTGVLALMRKAEIIVLGTPMYFFNATAQLKVVIDRSQTFWSRKYRFHLKDPKSGYRKGVLLAMGGSKGKDLFDGIRLTATYFFDAVDADFVESLTYRGMEHLDDMRECPTVDGDVTACVDRLLSPFSARKKTILFAGHTNSGASVAAAAFARIKAGDRIEVLTGGVEPGLELNKDLVKVMGARGIDLGFTHPESVYDAVGNAAPDMVVRMGCGELPRAFSGAEFMDLNVSDITGESEVFIEKVCDDLEKSVDAIISQASKE